MNTHLELERQRAAFDEFADLTMAVKTEYSLDLVIGRDGATEDSVARGRFANGLIGLYTDKRRALYPEFLATGIDIDEVNRGLFLASGNRSYLIAVARTLQEYAKGTGFTIGL